MAKSGHSAVREIWAIVLIGVGVLLFLSLVSYRADDVSVNVARETGAATRNWIGPLGAWLAYFAFATFGMAAYLLPFLAGGFGVALLWPGEKRLPSKAGAAVVMMISAACLLHFLSGLLDNLRAWLNLPSAGGYLGLFVGDFAAKIVGVAGAVIVFLAIYLVSLVVLLNVTPALWFTQLVMAAVDFVKGLRKPSVRAELRERERELDLRKRVAERELADVERERRPPPKIEDRTVVKPPAEEGKPTTIAEKLPKLVEKLPKIGPKPAAEPAKKAEKMPAPVFAVADTNFQLPPLDLLHKPTALSQREVIEDLKQNAEVLRATLEDFGIKVEMGDVTKGPTVTCYEFHPDRGVKVERIAALSNNIALAMKATNVRILTPIPGKGTVGIEVPNTRTTTVYLRDMLESGDWRNASARIPIALGRDVGGNPIIADLADCPHLLIAGATGSGKTVCVNAIIASLLYRFTPSQLRFVMVDPKIVELQPYTVLPHLLVPVVTDPKKVPLALRWVINEMERRYQIFAKAGVRNIVAFNSRIKRAPDEKPKVEMAEGEIKVPRENPADAGPMPETLPYIVVIIDELADLMLAAPAEVENGIARLAQLSRAVGIHMIIATQRPSVDVVTGVIKANFPARVAFQVAAKVDSRTILDANGADKLLGKGDMLYLPPGSSKLIRAQGVLVLDEEIKRVVEFWGKQGAPKFEHEIHQKLQKETVLPSDYAEEEDEELIEQALEVIRQTQRASVSVLQRRLRIGYTRAARVMDVLEERGIVGPNKGAEPRDILVDLDVQKP